MTTASTPRRASVRPSPVRASAIRDLDVVGQHAASRFAAVRKHDDAVASASKLGGDRAADKTRAAGYRNSPPARRARCRERGVDGPGAVAEDPGQLIADHEPIEHITGDPARHLVVDLVVNHRPAVDLLEPMTVLPAPIRPAHLDVGELSRRLVAADPRQPSHGDAEQRTDAIADLEPLAHRLRRRRVLEPERGWGDAMEVGRVCEEPERLVDGSPHQQRSPSAAAGSWGLLHRLHSRGAAARIGRTAALTGRC